MLATGRSDGAISSWTVNPLGGIGLPTQYGSAVGSAPALAVASADLDGDGVVEIVRQYLGDDDDSAGDDDDSAGDDDDSPIARLSARCDGGLAEITLPGIEITGEGRLIATTDVEPDGDVDLLSVQIGGPSVGLVTAHLNDGAANFSTIATGITLASPLTSSYWSLGRTPVDHTGDGIADLVECGWTPGGYSLCLMHPGQGDGTFTSGTAVAVLQSPVQTVVQGDFNGDGAADLLVGLSDRGDPGQLYFLSGDGNGSFLLPTTSVDVNTENEGELIGAEGRGVAMPMDINQDTDLDLVLVWDTGISSSNRAIATALGNGNGGFSIGPVLSFVTDSPYPQSREWVAVPSP